MSDTFSEPQIDEDVEEYVVSILEYECPEKPWFILDKAESAGIARKEARKVLRKLRLKNELVPCGDFTGKYQLVTDND